MLGAMVIIGHQVAAKATRNALYLSNFPVTSLPVMTMGAALSSLVLVLLASRAMAALGPARLVPGAFLASAVLHAAEWTLISRYPRPVAVIFYIHFSALGGLLISGFWSVVNERFDPHTTKKHMGQLTGGGTLGALLGGLMAERMGAMLPISFMLPVLGVMHVCCAGITTRLSFPSRSAGAPTGGVGNLDASAAVLSKLPYLRNLAALILLGAAGATMMDYVFMARASSAFNSGALLRVLAAFYTATSLIGFVIQTALTRLVLEKAGLGATVSVLPVTVTIGSLGASLVPGIGSAAVARGLELVVYNSFFRSGYELFYTSVPPVEKRAAKPLIDVGFERLGDITGSAMTRSLLWLAPAAAAQPAILGTAAGLGLVGLWFARQLDRGYITALEKSLRTRAVELNLEELEDKTTRATVMRTYGSLPVTAMARTGDREEARPTTLDRVMHRINEMRCGDPNRVRNALNSGSLNALLAAQAITLLAWNDVAEDAARALQRAGPTITGQLIDAMVEESGDNFSIRRRIPRVLSACPSARAVSGLTQGLADRRFEVRFRCGKALASIQAVDERLSPATDQVLAAITRELEAGKHIWESHQLLDGYDEDELVGARANHGLEHVFTLLSLILPRQPLRISFQALHTDDAMLRGTALEYLQSVLPGPVWVSLWPYLADGPSPERTQRKREEILAQLMQSHESIEVRLQELRAKQASQA